MQDPELEALADALARLLRGGRRGGVYPDGDGWVRLEAAALAVGRATSTHVHIQDIQHLGRRLRRFEIARGHVRIADGHPRVLVPDVLFAATSRDQAVAAAHAGVVLPHATGAPHRDTPADVRLVSDADTAWRLAWQHHPSPHVLVIDAARARKAGVRFRGGRTPGTYRATPIPTRFVLDLRPGYGEQHSAGGLPVREAAGGGLEVLLVAVRRRSGTTWEVAKGKLEDGETPETAAVREVSEETGLSTPLRVIRHVHDIRYGFLAPGGRPRLKTVWLYLMAVDGPATFRPPAEGEGIQEVRWFPPDEAAAAVTHPSLIPAMARARDLLDRYGLSPARAYAPSLSPRTPWTSP